jgi:hypothetical protein
MAFRGSKQELDYTFEYFMHAWQYFFLQLIGFEQLMRSIISKSPRNVNGGKASVRLFQKLNYLKIQNLVARYRLKRKDRIEKIKTSTRKNVYLSPKVWSLKYLGKISKKRIVRQRHSFRAFRKGFFILINRLWITSTWSH